MHEPNCCIKKALVAANAWASLYPNKGLKNNEYEGILSIQVHEVDSFSAALQIYNLCKALEGKRYVYKFANIILNLHC